MNTNNLIISEIENKHITDVKINDGIVANKTVVGTFIKNTAEIQIINLNHTYDNLLGKEINIQGFGTWYVNELSTDEEYTESKLNLYDVTYKFDADYEDTFPFPDTMKNWAIWIGNKVGVPLKGSFLNEDLILTERPYLGQNPKYRDAVQKIAKYASSYARKNYDNTYSICWFEDDLTEIEDWEDFIHGNTTQSTNVLVLSTGDTEDNVKWPLINPDKPHELRIEDEWTNIDRYAINEAIYNQVSGFFYTPISKLNVPYGLLDLRAGQKIKTQDMELQDIETYISKVTLEWQGGEFDDLNAWTTSLQMEELSETSTKLEYANGKRNRLLNVERLADKNNGLISDLIEEQKETETNISKIELDLNGITEEVSKFTSQAETISKIELDVEGIKESIGSITDTTTMAQGTGNLILENVLNSEILYLQIYPTKTDLAYLYPANDLYPNNDVYPLSRDLIIKGEDKTIRLTLPCDLYYINDDIKDEFILNYTNQEMYAIHRVAMDANGNKVPLSEPQTEYFVYQSLILEDGDYEVKMLSFTDAFIYIRTLAKNLYTSQYATKIELNSAINLTQESILSSVDKKITLVNGEVEELNSKIELTSTSITQEVNRKITNVNNEVSNISGKLELKVNTKDLISEINASADVITLNSNRLIINSSYFKLSADGKIIATSGEIGGFSLGATQFSNNINGLYDYSTFDLLLCQTHLLGNIHIDNLTYNILDATGDGNIGSGDLVRIRQITLGNYASEKQLTGTVRIDSNNPKNCLSILDSNNDYAVQIGLGGVCSKMMIAQNIVCAEVDTNHSGDSRRVAIDGPRGRIYCTNSITCSSLSETSRKENKKNFERFENALSIINDIDLYKYNLKDEEDGYKKHIGFVIGENYNYSSEITAIDDDGKECGVDLYSMTSLTLQSVKELLKRLEKVEEKING